MKKDRYSFPDYCVMCGDTIPEGRMVCPNCEDRVFTQKNKKETDMKEFIKRIAPRFRSWALWLSLAALFAFCTKEFAGIDISETLDGFMNVLLPVLVAFGIINNPTDKSSF